MNMYQSEIIPTAVLSRELWNRLRGKTTCSASQIHAADKVILWCSPQSNLRGQHLEVCFSKKSLKRGRLPAPLLPWLTALSRGATPQDTLIQSDTPDLSWAVRLARHAARTAWLKRPHHATQAVPSQPSFPGLPLLPPQEPASRILRTQSQRLPSQNKAVPSEFGSDIVLAFLRRALRWTKHFSKWIIVFSLLQMACFAGQGWFFFFTLTLYHLWYYNLRHFSYTN